MTERLSALMHAEADTLDVPPVAATTVLARGRGLRRRRRAARGVAGLTVLAVIGGGALLVDGLASERATGPGPAGPVATDAGVGVTFSVGATVYLADGSERASVDDTVVKSLYYTSAGVLVRHGDNPYSDGGGPQRFSLVAPDGTVTPLDVTTEETVHATDPAQPYLAYAEDTARGVEVVVRDVVDDAEVARVPVPGARAGFLPVALDGDRVYLNSGDQDFVVGWRTGEVTQPGVVRGYPSVAGGHATVFGDSGSATIIDAVTGETLLQAEGTEFGYLSLSPDGRFAALETEGAAPAQAFDVYDVASGEHVSVPGQPYDYGWSAEGDLFRLQGSRLTTCDPRTGECTTARVDLASPAGTGQGQGQVEVCDEDGCTTEPVEDFSGELKLGGKTYES